jgi:hypothetical protein
MTRACPKCQCRGRIPHSYRVHWTPVWALELAYEIRQVFRREHS